MKETFVLKKMISLILGEDLFEYYSQALKEIRGVQEMQ